jgi:hypothetical protein
MHMSAFGGKADMTVCGNPLSRSLLGVICGRRDLIATHAFHPSTKSGNGYRYFPESSSVSRPPAKRSPYCRRAAKPPGKRPPLGAVSFLALFFKFQEQGIR